MKILTVRNGVLKAALLAGAMAWGASAAHAGTISYEAFFDWDDTNFSNQSLVFPQFDTPGQTLTSVTLTFEPVGTLAGDTTQYTAMRSAGSLTNGTEESDGDSISLLVQFTVTGSLFNGIHFNIDSPDIFDGNLAPNQVVTWTDGETFTEMTPSGTTHQTLSCPDCSTFVGAGTVTINGINAAGHYSGVLPTNYTQSATTQGEAIALITYNFTAAPEPGTEWLIGGTLVGLSCLVARRRRSRQNN